MPRSRVSYQQAGRIGGLRTAALTLDRRAHTQPARDARLQRYIDQVRAALPGLTDEADILRRAEMLRRADMIALSHRAAAARSRAAQARREADEAEVRLSAIDGD
jgi:phage tail protein X